MPVSYTDVVKDLKQSSGTINAMQNGNEIFKTESVYYSLGSTANIIGDNGQNEHVALCAPKDLAEGRFHTVVYPQDVNGFPGYLKWAINVKGGHQLVEKGTLTVKFGPNKESVEGSYHVTLKGVVEEVGGNFKMSIDS
jgi:hypothetical protein